MRLFEHARTPPEAEITRLIGVFTNEILTNEKLKLSENLPLLEGFTSVVNILTEDVKTYKGIDTGALTSVQSRAIAVLAVDYLNGELESKILLNFIPNYANRSS